VSDPLNPATWNRFSYVVGNPVNNTDSTGHSFETIADLVGLGADFAACADGDLLACGFLPFDVVAAALPGLPAPGAARLADEASDAARAARGAEDLSPVRIIVDEHGVAIPQYEAGSYWRAAMVTEEIDANITLKGWQSGYARGAKPEKVADQTKLLPNAPLEERTIEFVGVEGAAGFPRDANVVGIHKDPFRAIEVALGTGNQSVGKPGWYMRLDELRILPGECVDDEALFARRGLSPKFPIPIKGEFTFDGSIPPGRVINTIRWQP
jgi:hypothetical protein